MPPAPCHHQHSYRNKHSCTHVIMDNVGSHQGVDQEQMCYSVLQHVVRLHWLHQSIVPLTICEESQISVFANTWHYTIPISSFYLIHDVRICISIIVNEFEHF